MKTIQEQLDSFDGVKAKILIGYHAHCIDGFTAAWACWKGLIETTSVLNDNISYVPLEYGDTNCLLDYMKEVGVIFLVDFSIPIGLIKELTKYTKVVIIDHHKTAFENYGLNPRDTPAISFTVAGAEVTLDMDECGASLTWQYFFGRNTTLPKLIKYVRDYDLWQFSLQHTKLVNKVLRIEPKTILNWDAIFESMDRNVMPMVIRGESIQTYHDQIVQDLVDQADTLTIDGISGLAVNCSAHFASDVGNELAIESGTFGATWQQTQNGMVKFSLRSKGNFDVSAIAKLFGGGGHKNAAGFTLEAPDYNPEKGMTLWHSVHIEPNTKEETGNE